MFRYSCIALLSINLNFNEYYQLAVQLCKNMKYQAVLWNASKSKTASFKNIHSLTIAALEITLLSDDLESENKSVEHFNGYVYVYNFIANNSVGCLVESKLHYVDILRNTLHWNRDFCYHRLRYRGRIRSAARDARFHCLLAEFSSRLMVVARVPYTRCR